jgi:hypothetical protein
VADGAGFVEVVFSPSDPKATGKPRGKVVAYFLNREGSGAPDPAPTDVAFTDEAGKSYPLSPKSGDGSGGARFESDLLSLPSGIEPSGMLVAKFGGETVKVDTRPR